MNKNLFGISDPFKYAKILEREYERLSSSNNKQDQIDHALNFSSAAWHLADKVFYYPETRSALKKKGINDWYAFKTYIYSLCPELRICYDITISYKHYNREPAKSIKSTSQVLDGGIYKINGVPVSQFEKINGVQISKIAKINSIKISGNTKLIVTLTDGSELNFMDIAEAVNKFWQKELESLSH